jgi:hypothetical protein
MDKNLSSNEVKTPEKKAVTFPRWLLILISIVFVVACFAIVLIGLSSIFKVNGENGNYSVGQVILSSGLKDNQPVDIKNVFKPSDTIICTVKTTGVDGGIIGMRWFFGDKMIHETTNKAQNSVIYNSIRSSSSAILSEGKYHIDILIVDHVIKTVMFEIKIYHPDISPPISIPNGHKSIELPWFPEVPFAFDEIWKIDATPWKVNEVKVVLMDNVQKYFVAVSVDTNIKNVESLSKDDAKKIARPIALYALENHYIEKAKSFEIDGKHYDLDQYIYVNLVNPLTHGVFRVEFKMDELKSNSNPSG